MSGGGRKRRRSTSENIAALAPMPSASVTITPTVKPGCRRRPRSAYVASCHTASIRGESQTPRASSRMKVSFPIARRAASRASVGDAPRARRSRSSMARWAASSSASAASLARRRSRWAIRRRRRIAEPSGELEDVLDGVDDPLELRALGGEVLPTGRGERVIPRPAVVLRRAPLRPDVAVEQQALQGGVERALADLEDVARELLDALRDAVAVHRPADQRAEDEH